MTQLLSTWTHEACAWLEEILFERFGHRFYLETRSQDIRLSLAGRPGSIGIKSSVSTFTRSDSDLVHTEWVATREGWVQILGLPLPAPGVAALVSPLIEQHAEGLYIHYDLLGLTYWILSRQEEIGRTDLDEHGRFPAINSHAFKHGYLERPVVDEWLHVLGQVMRCQWPDLELKKHHFKMTVSHDVDIPSIYGFQPWLTVLRMMASHALKQRDLSAAINALRVKLGSAKKISLSDPANTFDWLMSRSEHYGLQSAFYFICGRTNRNKDADYELENPAIRELMKRIHMRGHELGLHPSYDSYCTPMQIKTEFSKLKKVCEEEGIQQMTWGGRMHYLRWRHPITLNAWNDAGLQYDSTLGYADKVGFRCGTCFEYPAFDPVRSRMLNLRIRPLLVMDDTILNVKYMGLGKTSRALEKINYIKDVCKLTNGQFTLLWHNSQLMDDASRDLYEAIIK